jgi:hypothetical protein
MTPSGIEPATFRFVAQYLNHCATISGPLLRDDDLKIHFKEMGLEDMNTVADFCDTAMNIRFYWKTEEILTSRELLRIMEKFS